MKWADKCILELTHRGLFENDGHRSRFRDLLNCYSSAPFFTKGLCKCMYIGAWNNLRFEQILDILNETTIEHDNALTLMKDNCLVLQKSAQYAGSIAEAAIMKLSNAFLNDLHCDRSILGNLEITNPECAYIIKCALLASQCIDDLPNDIRIQSNGF